MADTRIFARVEGGRQWLAYQMTFSTDADTAMILPLPVVPGSGDDALRFEDLSGYPTFFEDLDRAFWSPPPDLANIAVAGGPRGGAVLEVHQVGDFEASYVPTLADFSRLDPRFRLPADVWDALPQCRDFGFAVFQFPVAPATRLDTLRKRFGRPTPRVVPKRPHPMAFHFPSRSPETVFFPTVHVHDGRVHAKEHFDHLLYAQTSLVPQPLATTPWIDAPQPAGRFVDLERARGLVLRDERLVRLHLRGELPNEDVVLRAA